MEPAENQEPRTEPEQPTSSLKQIRTFQGDVAETIKTQNESVVSIQKAELARKDTLHAPNSEGRTSGNKTLLYLLMTVVLLAAGGLGAWYAYSSYKEKTAPPLVETPANQLVRAESLVNIDASTMSRDALIVTTGNERARPRSANTIEQMVLRRGTGSQAELLNTSDFFTRLNVHAPDALLRSLGKIFMFGFLGGTPSHAFIIIDVDSFQNAFPGMLSWESRMAEDLLPLFVSEAVVASVPTDSVFIDETIQNRDLRALKDPSGQSVLVYAFFDTNKLIITDNEETFRAIVNRLQSEKLSR